MPLSNKEEIILSANKTILDIFINKNEIHIGDGLLIMAAYIQFVYPKEAKINVDYTKFNLDLKIFKIIRWDKTKLDNDDGHDIAFYRRLRNSISHANVEFCSDTTIELYDGPPRSNPFKENFRVKVNKADFGNKFLKEIMLQWMKFIV